MENDSKGSLNFSRRSVLSHSVAVPFLAAAVYRSSSTAEAAECAPGAAIGPSLGESRVTRVVTTCGPVRGLINESIHTFKGIPYGRTPVGKLRFKASTPPDPWTAMFDATNYGPASPQLPLPSRMTMDQARTQSFLALNATFQGSPTMLPDQSEACLVLNVWTPAVGDGAKRAVMFRIHGGGFFVGSGAWSWHDGTNLARRGDVVVVTVNHRLSALGYLYLGEAMGADYAAGNAGMMDLVLALQWVRDNIAAFGGDPGNVTIFGESGGGAKVSTLLAMPPAAGLFARAIVQSGPALKSTPRDVATSQAKSFLAKAGIAPGDSEKLQSLSVEAIFDALTAAGVNPIGLGPCVDGITLVDDPGDALAKGMSANVPLIVGTTLDEGTSLHTADLPTIKLMDEATLHAAIGKVYGNRADGLIRGYRKAFPKAFPGEIFIMIEAASLMRRRSWDLADAKLSKGNAPVYMYLLEWKSGAQDGMIMAGHGICVPLTMDNTERSGSWTADYPDSGIVAASMSEAWIAFAKTGNPSAKGYAEWPSYDPHIRETMVFDVVSRAVKNPHGEHEIWAGVPEVAFGPFAVPGGKASALDSILKPQAK